jgi:hypothetical protein
MTNQVRRRPRLRWLLVGALSLGLLATACADDLAGDGDDLFGDPTNGAPADPVAPANGAGDPMPPANGAGDPLTPPADGDAAPGAELSGTMSDVAGLGVSGSVAVAEVAGEAEVDVSLVNLPDGAYMAHIITGDCEAPGNIAYTLGQLPVSPDGDAEAFYVVPAPVEQLAVGHSVIVEDADAEVVACAELA